eukprot:TRINITY_DN41184_c0_g1_i4.p1 TRINITY_DN41184_c0_g1~~TRINITY_DN41184_c0_g1_i4.p1  ORF type:complete len:167 (-),score=10.67 TRINITY_DN41184_c0_g1_i4:11-478(-)
MDHAGIGIGPQMPRGEVRIELGLVGLGNVTMRRSEFPRRSDSVNDALTGGGHVRWSEEALRRSEGHSISDMHPLSGLDGRISVSQADINGRSQDGIGGPTTSDGLGRLSDALPRLSHSSATSDTYVVHSEIQSNGEIGRAVQQECRDRSRMPSSA